MKKLIAILLATLILSISLKDLAIYALFKANQDQLAETICINRFSPDELCQATCVFTQTIIDSQEQQENYPSTSLEKQQQVVFTMSPIILTKVLANFPPKIVPTKSFHFLSSTFISDVFHPPEC